MHLFIRQGWRLAGIGIIVVTSWLLIIGFLSASGWSCPSGTLDHSDTERNRNSDYYCNDYTHEHA